MRVIFSLFALVALFSVCTLASIEKEDGVYVLGKDNFDDFVNDDGVSLVEFYAPWCGHCKKLTPEYAKAAQTLSGNDPVVRLAKVDATIEGDLASRFGVTGYPTLKVFRSGSAAEYKGPRDASGIVSYMKKQAAPAITDLRTLADVEKFIAEEAAVVFFGDMASEAYKAFHKASEKMRETYRFAKAEAAEILEKFPHKDQVAVLQSKRYTQSPLEKAVAVFEGVADKLTGWLESNILPLVGEVNEDNMKMYHSGSKPVVKLYSDIDWKLNSKGANYLMNKVRKIAKDYSDKFHFAFASKSKNGKEIEDAGLKGELPFLIMDKMSKYPFTGTFSPEALKEHLESFLAHKLEPYLKSEPVPDKQVEGEPVVVTGKTFESIVMDPTKDVLIEAYAPWCGHCKQLEPKYKELAKKMAKYSDTLTIAKIDATANDVPSPYTAKGYPTIYFAPANNKDKPLTYDSQREVKDFENYIKRHATLPLKERKDEL